LQRKTYGITFKDVTREFPETNPTHLAWTLSEMVKSGMLYKVARNNYHIIPQNADPESYVPDANQVAKCLMKNRAYYIGYCSALKIHGLALNVEAGKSETDVYLVTGKQMKPAIKSVGGIDYHLIHSSPTRFFGFESIWINQFEKAMVSDLEKTIVDMASTPRHCKGITGLGHAIFKMNKSIDQNRLFNYFARNENKSGKKRYLYLTELLGLDWNDKHDLMLNVLGPGISLLDPLSANQGEILKKFQLKINLDPTEIKNQILDMAKEAF
jgi:predicted transcriptional regulator of viral defense system